MRRYPEKALIRFVPMGGVDASLVSAIAAEAGSALGLPVEIAPVRSIEGQVPHFPGSCQYSSVDLLKDLGGSCEGRDITVAVTELDLSYPGLNYVFGLADDLLPVAVVSIARLARGGRGAGRVVERAVKTAVHEVGHLLGLKHCGNRRCVMFFSHNLSDTDHKGKAFCAECRRRLEAEAGLAGLRPAFPGILPGDVGE